MLYQLHATLAARVVGYCAQLGTAAASPWDDDSERTAGIRPGMPLAEATALAGYTRRASSHGPVSAAGAAALPLHLEMHDPLADRLALEELAEWCRRFSPTVGLDEAAGLESLLLDVSGLGPLFGGEPALAQRVAREFHERNLTARVAIADTFGAAWALAHFAALNRSEGPTKAPRSPTSGLRPRASSLPSILAALRVPILVPEGQTGAAIAPLGVEALRLPQPIGALLADLGLRRIEQVAVLPRATLLARFGPLVLERLDQANGTVAEVITARAVEKELEFQWLFEQPTGRREMIEFALGELVAQVCDALARERRGVLRLQCRFEYEGRSGGRFIVGLYRPSASPRHVGDLVRLKFEAMRFCEPLSAIHLTVLAVDRLEFRQREIFSLEQVPGQRREAPRELAALIDRLSNRLGPHAVARPWLLASALPEFACQYKPLASLPARRGGKARSAAPTRIAGDLPLHLEPQPRPLSVVSIAPEGPPVQFRCLGRDERIAHVWGPERIETRWWRTRCVRRDYYQVETAAGERFWLFRQLNTGEWFLQGEFV